MNYVIRRILYLETDKSFKHNLQTDYYVLVSISVMLNDLVGHLTEKLNKRQETKTILSKNEALNITVSPLKILINFNVKYILKIAQTIARK